MTRDDVERILVIWQARLGLRHWNLRINWDLQPEPDDEGKPALAQISVHPDYDQATIRINGELFEAWTPAATHVTIVHELLHVYERGVRNANVDVGTVMSDKLYSLHWSRYEHEVEGMIDRLAAVIVELVGVDSRG